MYRYKWNHFEKPCMLSYKDLVEKYKFYKFVQKWDVNQNNNELLDKIQDLRDEIIDRDTCRKINYS